MTDEQARLVAYVIVGVAVCLGVWLSLVMQKRECLRLEAYRREFEREERIREELTVEWRPHGSSRLEPLPGKDSKDMYVEHVLIDGQHMVKFQTWEDKPSGTVSVQPLDYIILHELDREDTGDIPRLEQELFVRVATTPEQQAYLDANPDGDAPLVVFNLYVPAGQAEIPDLQP